MRTAIPSFIAYAVLLITASLAALPAKAQDVWTSPNPGLKHLHRTTVAPADFHVLIVDLSQPGVRIRATPSTERWKTTSRYAMEAKLAGAINAGPWSLFSQRAMGLAASNGEIWAPDNRKLGFFSINTAGVASITSPKEPRPSLQDISEGVAGYSLLVDSGKITPEILRLNSGRDARTAVGVSMDGKKVIFVTADGRQEDSVGASLDELGQIMIEFGATRALNLDGGNSTTMYIEGEGGVVNHPSRGWEREAITHIGVIASAPTLPITPAYSVETPKWVQILAARPIPEAARGTRGRLSAIWLLDRVVIGPFREWLMPGFIIVMLLTLVLIAVIWFRRARKIRTYDLS